MNRQRQSGAIPSSIGAVAFVRAAQLDPLTARETEVVRLIAEGYSTKEIAAHLGITFKTAVCHRTRVMQKLDIHEIASLVRYAIRCGLIQP